MKLQDIILDFEINTTKGKFNYYDFSGGSLIICYGGKDSGVGLTEMAWLNRHSSGLLNYNINIFAIFSNEDIEEVETNVRLMSGDAVMYLIVNAETDLLVENEKVLYLIDKDKKIIAMINYLLSIGFNLVESLRVYEANLLKKVGLNTLCNWLGMLEMTWEDKEIVDETLTDKDIEMRFGKHTLFGGVKFIKREVFKEELTGK